MPRISRVLVAVATLVALALSVAPASAGKTSFRVPAGYRSLSWQKLGDGLDHVNIRGNAAAQNIHVARLASDAPFALRAVVARQAISGGLETTSSMCKRVGCLAGVNGDFFQVSGDTTGQTTGGLAIFGQALRSPNAKHPQLLIDENGRVSAGADWWKGGVVLADGRSMTLDGINVALRGGKISLFTAAYGKSTRNRNGTAEIAVRIEKPKPPLLLGQPAQIRFLTIRHIGDAPIPADGAVLAGDGAGAQALDALWWQIKNGKIDPTASVVFHSANEDALDSIGGAPLLLKDGRRAFTIVPRGLVQGRHPRTVVGWNKQGEVFLVTFDGRQPGHADGMSLLEITAFMARMGATDAINLDGGGSTTFVARGRVVNSPSDVVVRSARGTHVGKEPARGERVVGHRERGVASALVIVPVKPKPRPASPAPSAKPAPVAPAPAPLEREPMALPPAAEMASAGRATPKDHAVAIAFMLALGVGAAVVRSAFVRLHRGPA